MSRRSEYVELYANGSLAALPPNVMMATTSPQVTLGHHAYVDAERGFGMTFPLILGYCVKVFLRLARA
jgi:hypothetical protein